jgi:hypothetical protein
MPIKYMAAVRRLLAAGLQRRHWTILPKRLGGFSRWQRSYADTTTQHQRPVGVRESFAHPCTKGP